jgi:protein TonB
VTPPAAVQIDPAAALARFRQQIVELAVRYKRYPRMARDNGWTGDVVVRIEVSPSGTVNAISLKSTSGYEILDEQALEMFRKAAPAVSVPPDLRGQAFAVEVRAIYSLQDRPS